MAMLRFRHISLEDWLLLEDKDPNTRYIVCNEDESIYGEFIGENKVTAEVEARLLSVEQDVELVDGKIVAALEDVYKKDETYSSTEIEEQLEEVRQQVGGTTYQSASSWAKVVEVPVPEASHSRQSVTFLVTAQNTTSTAAERYIGILELNAHEIGESSVLRWLVVSGFGLSNFNLRLIDNMLSIWVLPTIRGISFTLLASTSEAARRDNVKLFYRDSGETRTGASLGNSEKANIQDIADVLSGATASAAELRIAGRRIKQVSAGVEGTDAVNVNQLNEVVTGIYWQELKDLRDSSALVPGRQYRITDYECTTVQANTQSAGHQFDIIVVADDVNKLNENARACLHEGDNYFTNSKLEAWKLMYCLDNDTDRFAWADSVNGKGVIYRMVDEFNNDVPYDFKNIQYQEEMRGFAYNQWGQDYTFTRDASLDKMIGGILHYGYVADREINGWSTMNCWLREYPATLSSVVYDTLGVATGYGDITAVISEDYAFYTFSKTKVTADNFDVSLNGLSYGCYGNTIRPYAISQDSSVCQVLNRITFVGWYMYTSSPGLLCFGNTFGNNCYDNTFGANCRYNAFGADCSSNTFGESCNSNTFGNNCSNNTFGSDCYINDFSDTCYYNSFGNNCSANRFGSDCSSNSFGHNCSSNTFGNDCRSNTFGGDCYYNAFGSYCQSNAFGNSCLNNSFGSSIYANALDNYCRFNTFGNDCQFLKITEISSNEKKYIHVENGTKGASSANKLELFDVAIMSKSYQVTFKRTPSGKYLMLWANDNGTMTGKVKATNTTPTWSNIV